MGETMAPANRIPDSTTMLTLESTTHIPIAQLTPSLPASASRSIKAVVTLTWPYSSRTGSVAFLLAEPDFRLRRTKGQVRVQFSGSSANIIANSGIASGDEVVLCLDGVEYVEAETINATPGRGVEFELKFTERVLLQFQPEESQDVKYINIDHPDPEPVPTTAPAPATDIETETQVPDVPTTPASFSKRVSLHNVEEYSSPAFLKRERTSYGSIFDEGYDPFEVEDGSVFGKGRKRTRLSTSWRFTSRSPSPSPEVEELVAARLENGIQGPATQHAPATTDEGVQTMEVEAEVTTEATQTPNQSRAKIIEGTETNGIVEVVHAEPELQERPQVEEAIANTMPPPQKQSNLFIPEIERQETSPDDIVEKLPSSPQLRPLPSEDLPLVSPLVTSRFEMFNNHIHNDHTQHGAPNVSAVLSAEADTQIQVDDKEDIYGVSPPRRVNDQPKSTQASHQISTIPSENEYGPPTTEAFTPHQQSQFEAEQSVEQLFAPYNVSEPDPYTSVGVYAGMSGEQGQYIPGGMEEEDMAQYNYPDPEQVHPQSNNWGAQSSMAYPDLEGSQQSAIHSPYPHLLPMPPIARSQSNQSHQSHQSQVVDLTESDDEDEDAEGVSDVEDDRQEHMPNSHLPVDDEEENLYDEEEEDGSSIYDDDDKVQTNEPLNGPEGDDYGDEYEEDYSGEDAEKMDLRNYIEEDGTGSEDDYDEDNYSDNGMDNEAPLQRQPPREPEVIDLLSSDEEDDEPAAASKPQSGTPDAQDEDDFEDDERIEEEEDMEEDEDEDEDDGEGKGEESLNIGGEVDMPTTKSQEFVRESSSESDGDEVMENESTLVKDGDKAVEIDAEIPEMVPNESESGPDTRMDVDASLYESKGAQSSHQQQENAEEEELVPEPMDIESKSAKPSTATVHVGADNSTDNLDGLFEKLEEAGSETQLEQGSSNFEGDEPQNDSKDLENDVEDIGNEDIVPNLDEENTGENPSEESKPAESAENLPAEELPHYPILTEDNEKAIDFTLDNSPSAPIDVEKSSDPTIPNPELQRISNRAAKSGWSKVTSFVKTFGLDGANDASDEGDEDNQGQISYPRLPVAGLEDQQESADESEQNSQSKTPTRDMDITINHSNDQLLTPDDTQRMDAEQESFDSISDLLQSQLQEEMGEMDEDLEIIQNNEGIEKDSSMDLVEDDDQISAQEEIDEDQDVVTDTEAMDKDDIEVIDPELDDFKVEITKMEMIGMDKIESTEPEVKQVDQDFVEGEVAEDGETGVEHNKGGRFEVEKSEVDQIEIDIKMAEMTELETQRALAKLVDTKVLGQDTEMVEIDQVVEGTIEETEAVADTTEAIILEQIRRAPSTYSARNRDDKEPSPKSKRGRKESSSVSPRQTRSSAEPSPELKKSRKGSTAVSPRQTRSKGLEPVIETNTPITPTRSNKENMPSSTHGSNRSRRSPSIVLDEEEIPQGHDASAEMALESLESHDSATKAGHHLRSPACTDPKVRLTKYLRTDLSEYTTLKMLRFKMSLKLDILAIATSVPPEPQRAKGPRHYTTTFTVTDQTIAPSGVVEVRIFRPYKDALPTPAIGDGILLRDFSVQSVKGKGFALKSEEGSSWAVFKDEGTEVEVTGPPVEYAHGEKKHMKELRDWFHALDDEHKTKLEKVSTAMEKSSPTKSSGKGKEAKA
ncbi:hypothetical protein NHQ30_001005 [Ciborinia camelliae]|nr:hypothetical protein NHQ30_001005 [Ciborinia camelliae]